MDPMDSDVRVDITGRWKFLPDPAEEGYALGYPSNDHDSRYWLDVHVPTAFDGCTPSLAAYEGLGWFRRTLDIPQNWKDRHVVLRLEGANYRSRVWVNGHLVGESLDGFLRADFVVSDALVYGQTNSVVVAVDSKRHVGDVPGLKRGWRPYGGILREVLLLVGSPVRSEHLRVVAKPAADGGSLMVSAHLTNWGEETHQVAPRVSLHDADGGLVYATSLEPLTLEPGQVLQYHLEDFVDGAKAWSPGEPKLYTASLELLCADEILDRQQTRIGFREIQALEDSLLLNGQPIFLTGLNRHEDSPRTGMCPDLAQVRRDLEDMKAIGSNFVRLCHYPHHPAELDLCDELGLLVMSEIPLYWWQGNRDGDDACHRTMEAAKRQLRRMIERDCNHPCIIFWSVSNENDDSQPEVNAGNQELIAYARGLDATRLITRVSDRWTTHTTFELDDVISINAYPSWSGRLNQKCPNYDVSLSAAWWSEKLTDLHSRYPGKPILVTELGYPALDGVTVGGAGEEFQARAIETEFGAVVNQPYIVGAVIWCYADHPWPEEDFLSQVTTSPFGIVGRERRRKPAYEAVRHLFTQRQGLALPQPQAVDWNGDNVTVDMVRENMENIPMHTFPEGFSIRAMREDEGAVWEDVWRDAEPYFSIEPGLFSREFGSHIGAVTERCFFIINASGAVVGTISGWYEPNFQGQEFGRIHWVAVRPAYQGLGLSKPAMSFVLGKLANWHSRCYLNTSTGRLAAIKTYLDFGFAPVLDCPGARVAWKRVQEKLGHWSLARMLVQ